MVSRACIIICIIYHPPLDNEAGLAEYLISSLDTVLDKNPNAGVMLVGNFNHFNFRILSNNFNLRQLVKAPTRGSATLDLILTNLFEHYCKPDILAGTGLSDCDVGTLMNNIRYESTLRDKNKRREKGGLLGDKGEGNEEGNEKILVQYIVLNLL